MPRQSSTSTASTVPSETVEETSSSVSTDSTLSSTSTSSSTSSSEAPAAPVFNTASGSSSIFDKFAYGNETGEQRFKRLRHLGNV